MNISCNAKNAIIQLLHIKLWHVKSRNWPYNEINNLWFRYRYDMNYLRTYTLLIFQKLSNDLCELIHIPHTFDLFSLIDALENVSSASFSRSLRAQRANFYYTHTTLQTYNINIFHAKWLLSGYDGNRKYVWTLHDIGRRKWYIFLWGIFSRKKKSSLVYSSLEFDLFAK